MVIFIPVFRNIWRRSFFCSNDQQSSGVKWQSAHGKYCNCSRCYWLLFHVLITVTDSSFVQSKMLNVDIHFIFLAVYTFKLTFQIWKLIFQSEMCHIFSHLEFFFPFFLYLKLSSLLVIGLESLFFLKLWHSCCLKLSMMAFIRLFCASYHS